MEGILLPCCSIFFSALLCIVYFAKRRVDLIENNMYATMLIAILIDSIIVTVLHIIGLYELTPSRLKIISVLNKFDFMLLIVYISSLFMYTTIITIDKARKNYKKLIGIISLINIIFSILILAGSVNVISQNGNYSVSGTSTNFIAIIVGLYIISNLIIVFTNFKKVDRRHLPIAGMIFIIVLLILLFQLNPYLIVISVSLSFLNYIMYFTIENPDLKMLKDMEMARNQAERANNAKSDFLSSMSHEIRTPLNAIVGLSEDIESFKDQVPEQVVEDTEDIRSASKTLLEIVGNILDISKIESGKMEITNEVYKPKEEIETLAKIDATRIGEKPIDFKMDIAQDLPYELIGDRLHIKQVLNNLLSNSFKYTEKGEVNLTVKCINKDDICNLIISVKDTGRGIKAEDINKLFTKFERLDIEKNTTTEGTGLGLAITKSLVEMMGGKINVESRFGEGSMFVVSIPQKIKTMVNPLTTTQVIRLDAIRREALNNVNYGNKKILIVDDNKLNIKVARRALNDFNFELDECYDGLECLEKVKNGNEYDLILMDIMMPNMSGETAMAKLKENPNFNIPTIALTADAVAGAKEKYISEGFVDYIAKPFSKEQIKEKLDKVFEDINEVIPIKNNSLFDDSVEKELSDMSKSLDEIEIDNKSEKVDTN